MTRPDAEDTATQALPMRLLHGASDRLHANRIKKELAVIEQELAEHLGFASPIADAPARYLMEAGGKRVRPVLTLLTSELGEGPSAAVRKAAESVELIHLASLYHDDVMDDTSLRRGVPAVHTVWNNTVAILAGDLLFARASSLAAGMGDEVIALQARTFERLCLGQLHETVGPGEGDDPREFYIQVLADKTGALIAAAARLGVLCGNAPREYADPVTAYGEKIGVAFQLIDDVIDLSPKKEATGKRAGTDLRAGVVTLPTLLLSERAAAGDEAAAALLRRIDEGVARIREGAPVEVLDAEVEELRAHEVTAETEAEARRWAADAKAELAVLPAGAARRALEQLADAIVNREG